jgi:integrase
LEDNPTKAIKAPDPGDTFAHAPYSDEQYKAILDNADWYVDERVRNGERDVYCKRMHAFLELLRWTGMDIIDAVQFHPAQIEDTKVDGVKVSVLRYRRQKTARRGGVEAVIPLTPQVAKKLRSVPSTPKSVDGLPFRYQGNDLKSDVHNWSRRISALIKLADIGEIPLMGKDGRPALDKFGNAETTSPDVKMLRHTFAVGELLKGVAEEVVAKMLGHASTEMIRKHYAPWCKRRDDAHIRAVVASRKK